MQLTQNDLKVIMPNASLVKIAKYLPILNSNLSKYQINTPVRISAFLANVAVETGELNTIEESFNYSAERLIEVFPRAFNKDNAAMYAGLPRALDRAYGKEFSSALGNGPEISGEGSLYRGRGLMQITGKFNYTAFAKHVV